MKSLLHRLLSWQALAILGTFGLGVPSLVFAYFAIQQPKAGVTFETISEANVFEVHRTLDDLDIIFRGQNIQEKNLNLKIFTISVFNSGGGEYTEPPL